MPVAEINVIAGRTPEQKSKLLHAVSESVLESLQVGRHALSVWLREFPREQVLCPEGGNEHWMTIRITCFSGRTTQIKRQLYRCLAHRLEQAGEDAGQCSILVVDTPMENWGILGGQCAMDVLPPHRNTTENEKGKES